MAYDLCMLLIVVYTTWRGSVKGVAWQLAAIGAMVLCFLFATPASAVVAPLIKLDPPLNRWIAMLAIYLVFSFGCFAIARAVRSALEAARFEEFDKHLGAVFGLVKGVAICFTITFFAVCLSKSAADTLLQTHTGQLSQLVMQNIEGILPAEIERVLQPYADKLQSSQIAGQQDANLPASRRRPNSRAADRTNANPSRTSSGYRPTDEFRGSARGSTDDAEDTPVRRPQQRSLSDEESSDTNSSDSLGNVVRNLPQSVKDNVRDTVTDIVRNQVNDLVNPPGTRNSDVPRTPITRAVGTPTGRGAERKRLIAEIAAVFYTQVDDLAAAEADTQAILDGVPDDLAIPALQDWYADLYGEPDPDPATDLSISLEDRVRRSVRAARVSWDDLPAKVRRKFEVQE